MHFDLQIGALAAVLWVTVGVCCCASSSGRRFYAQSTFIDWGRGGEPREMIVVYLRLASGEEMTTHMLVVICASKHILKACGLMPPAPGGEEVGLVVWWFSGLAVF